MRTKLVVRLLDVDGRVLGASKCFAVARGDGYLHAESSAAVLLEASGVAAAVSVQWCDINTEIVMPLHTMEWVSAHQAIELFPAGPIFKVGDPCREYPPFVERDSVALGVPLGSLGMVGTR